MSPDLPPPPTDQDNGARSLAVLGLILFGLLSLAPSFFSPLNALVPEPYFLRSQSAASALPFQVMTAALYVLLSFVAAWKKSKVLAVLVLIAVPAMALLTFVRLMFGGGFSGGI